MHFQQKFQNFSFLMKEFDESLRSDSGYVSSNSYNLLHLEEFPLWNSKVIWREFSSRYQIPYHLLLSDWHNHKDCDNFIFNSFAFYTHS